MEEYENKLIDNWNRVVGNDDIVYHLGDVGNLPFDELSKKIKSLNGKKILIRGNHDTEDKDFYLRCGFTEVIDGPMFYNKNVILSHEPVPVNNDYFINVHGHLHGAVLDLKKLF